MGKNSYIGRLILQHTMSFRCVPDGFNGQMNSQDRIRSGRGFSKAVVTEDAEAIAVFSEAQLCRPLPAPFTAQRDIAHSNR
jgi:hypothetical protein